MKEIIYLNTSMIHSFMAQNLGGLPINMTQEQSQQESQTSNDATKKSSTHDLQAEVKSGNVQVPFLASSPSGSTQYRYLNARAIEESISITQVDAGKEIISKQLHDNALNEFIEYLESESKLNKFHSTEGNAVPFGEYVLIKGSFSLFDLEIIRTHFEPSILKEIIQIPTMLVDDPVGKGKGKGKLDPNIEKGIKIFDLILRYFGKLLPTNLILKQDSFISPLKPEYLRESSAELVFKYGLDSSVEVTVLGRVTKKFETFNYEVFSDTGPFKDLGQAIWGVEEFLLSGLKSLQRGDTIISPVAIYFE
ncbi:hypothetical protein [Paenibacillus sp. GCM10027626]|uniref:DUF6414 family protein n=1 Tax=Paenibacillus sp. GCM10027626 TaxID=3273411 RepID=UPI003638A38F